MGKLISIISEEHTRELEGQSNDKIITELENLLDMARDGRVQGFGYVSVDNNNWVCVNSIGNQIFLLLGGATKLVHNISKQIDEAI